MAKTNNPKTFAESTKTEAFIDSNKKTIIIVAVSILVLIGAIVGGNFWMKNREQKAQTLLTLGQPYIMQGEFDKALNGEGKFPGYLKIASSYGMTDAANLAHYYAGVCYFKKKDFKKAVQELEDFSPKTDHTVSPQAVYVLANAYAETNQLDKAVDKFIEAAKLADNAVMSPDYLVLAGELLLQQNKKEEAKKVFEQIKSQYPDSRYSIPQRAGNGTFTDALIDAYIERASK